MSTVIVFGDFNCPYSAGASYCASLLTGDVAVDWRGVQHAPLIPEGGEPVEGDSADRLDREIAEILPLLPGEPVDVLRRPSRLANTAAASAAHAGATGAGRAELRTNVFDAYWRHDADIADPGVLSSLGARRADGATLATWQAEWEGQPRTIVPIMVLPDGYISRGLGVLARMRDALEGDTDRLARR